MDINIEEKLKQDFFPENKYVEDGDSCEHHAMTHDDTEILGMFCDVTAIHGEDLKDVLVKGYLKRVVNIAEKEIIQKSSPTNYVKVGMDGWLYTYYMYADLSEYMADDIFINHRLTVHFQKEFTKEIDGEKYVVIFCKFRKNKKDVFLKCMDELNKKILITGHNSYNKIREDLGNVAYELEQYYERLGLEL